MNEWGVRRMNVTCCKEFCANCHSRKTSDGRWTFDPHHAATGRSLSDSEAAGWINNSVFYVDPASPDPGSTVLWRLNRTEYNNTVRDVLGVESRPVDQFPADDAGYGFDNIGDVLSVSSLHFAQP
jgi:hypothetical protein